MREHVTQCSFLSSEDTCVPPNSGEGTGLFLQVKFLASNRKAVVRELYNYHDKFDSVDAIQQKLKEEFSEHIARGLNFSIGYFEGRHQTKRWLISRQDVEKMYEKLQGKPEIFLWSDGKDDSKTVTEGDLKMDLIIVKGH